MTLDENLESFIIYDADNPPKASECEKGLKFRVYDGEDVGIVKFVNNSDKYHPFVTVKYEKEMCSKGHKELSYKLKREL